MSKREAVILCGCQASAKTSFCKEFLIDSHVHIGLDTLNSKAKEKNLIDACLNSCQSFVIDSVNHTVQTRKKYIELAKSYKFSVICYFFDTDLESTLFRNEQRERTVAPSVVSSVFYKFQKPSKEEGFEEVYIVKLSSDGKFIVTSEEEKRQSRFLQEFHMNHSENIYLEKVINNTICDKNCTLEEIETIFLSDGIKGSLVSISGDIYTKELIPEIKKAIKIAEMKCRNKTIIIKEKFLFKWKQRKEQLVDLGESCGVNISCYTEDIGWLFKKITISFMGSENEINDFTCRLKDLDSQT